MTRDEWASAVSSVVGIWPTTTWSPTTVNEGFEILCSFAFGEVALAIKTLAADRERNQAFPPGPAEILWRVHVTQDERLEAERRRREVSVGVELSESEHARSMRELRALRIKHGLSAEIEREEGEAWSDVARRELERVGLKRAAKAVAKGASGGQ